MKLKEIGHLVYCKTIDTDALEIKYLHFYNTEEEVHRSDGPAVMVSDGFVSYFLHNLQHRSDGPSVIWPTGAKEWWAHGKCNYKA